MSGGTNQMKPGGAGRRTGAPPGFTHGGGPSTMALVDYVNPATKQKWTASSGGWQAPEGWEVDQGDTWDAQGNQLTQKTGQEYSQWKDPNAPPKYGGWLGGGGFGPAGPDGGGWSSGHLGGGQLGGLIGGGQQRPQRRFPSMKIPGLLQYNQIDN